MIIELEYHIAIAGKYNAQWYHKKLYELIRTMPLLT